MFAAEHIWTAIDNLADVHGLTLRSLAVKAGLHPTALIAERRVRKGRHSWPSMETIAKLLNATEMPLSMFAGMITHAAKPIREQRTTLWPTPEGRV